MPAVDNPTEDRLKAFTRLMSIVSKLYHANLKNSPKSMNIGDGDVQHLLESLNRYNVQFLLVGVWRALFTNMCEQRRIGICG